MTDKFCFVQFPHPGGEHGPDTGKEWNRQKFVHRRKFMQLSGDWIDEDDKLHSGELRAWGEWEPESDLIGEFRTSGGSARHPRYLWRPYWEPKQDYKGLHNTDPFVFGDYFLYSNCGQTARNKRGLKHLAPGSVIAFGSGKTIKGERGWVLDTVMVVRDFVDYDVDEAHTVLRDWVSDTFLAVVGGSLCDNACGCSPQPQVTCAPKRTRLRLYRGATPEKRVNGMFSFFPAVPAGPGACFPRPVIELPFEYFNPGNWQAPKGQSSERTPVELYSLWEALITQVRANEHLVLGTRAELPEGRV